MAFFRLVILLALEIALCNIPLVLTPAQHGCASTIYSDMMRNVWDSSEQCSAVDTAALVLPLEENPTYYAQVQYSARIDNNQLNADTNSPQNDLTMSIMKEAHLPGNDITLMNNYLHVNIVNGVNEDSNLWPMLSNEYDPSEYFSEMWMYVHITVMKAIMTLIQFIKQFIYTVLQQCNSNIVKTFVMEQNYTTATNYPYLQESIQYIHSSGITTENDTMAMFQQIQNAYIVKPTIPVNPNTSTSTVDSSKYYTSVTRTTDTVIDSYKLTEQRNCVKISYLGLMKTAAGPEILMMDHDYNNVLTSNFKSMTSFFPLYMMVVVLASLFVNFHYLRQYKLKISARRERLAQIIAEITCNIETDSKNVVAKYAENNLRVSQPIDILVHIAKSDDQHDCINTGDELNQKSSRNGTIFDINISKKMYSEYKESFDCVKENNKLNYQALDANSAGKVDVNHGSDESIFNSKVSGNLYAEYKQYFNSENNDLMDKVNESQDDSIFNSKVSGNLYAEYKQFFNSENKDSVEKVKESQDDSIFNSKVSGNLYAEYKQFFNSENKDSVEKVKESQDDSIFNSKVSENLYAEYRQYFNNKENNGSVDKVNESQNDSIFNCKVSENLYAEYRQYFNNKENNVSVGEINESQDDSIFTGKVSENLYAEYKQNFSNNSIIVNNNPTDTVDDGEQLDTVLNQEQDKLDVQRKLNVFKRFTRKCGNICGKDKKNTVQPNNKARKFVKKLKSMFKKKNKIAPTQ